MSWICFGDGYSLDLSSWRTRLITRNIEPAAKTTELIERIPKIRNVWESTLFAAATEEELVNELKIEGWFDDTTVVTADSIEVIAELFVTFVAVRATALPFVNPAIVEEEAEGGLVAVELEGTWELIRPDTDVELIDSEISVWTGSVLEVILVENVGVWEELIKEDVEADW